MATLVRSQERPLNDTARISSQVPKPFPSQAEREQLINEDLLEELANEAAFEPEQAVLPGTSKLPSVENQEQAQMAKLHEIMPSIACVQKSCLCILNNLLSGSEGWSPIRPERRRSFPHSGQIPSTDIEESNSALETLVSNLRGLEGSGATTAACSSKVNTTSELIRELDERMQALSPSLSPNDATLARALVSLVSHFDRLSVIHSTSGHLRPISPPIRSTGLVSQMDDVFDTLKRQVSDLQVERRSHPDSLQIGTPPVVAVESALVWSRIDEELEKVMSMCRERTEGLPRFSMSEHMPPQYDSLYDTPPQYDGDEKGDASDLKPTAAQGDSSGVASSLNEKLRLDLDAVTMAIDRLYRVAPQLHDQRAELKAAKSKPATKNWRENGIFALNAGSTGKQKQKDIADLENIFDLLDKASDRKLTDQTVVLDVGMKAKLEVACLRDKLKRDAFVERLLDHSETGRLHDQDAVLQLPKTKDPDALLSLPEFIREPMPPSSQASGSHSIPGSLNEPGPEDPVKMKVKQRSRGRSASAPPISWLRPSSIRSALQESSSQRTHRPHTSKGQELSINAFNVHYVAENHENLHHILVFLNVTGVAPGTEIDAEVVAEMFSASSEGEYLVVKSGMQASTPLSLPGRTILGRKAVKIQRGHYEIKLPISTGFSPLNSASLYEPVPLMDASQLSSSLPTSITCASCSLPLVHSLSISQYRDLPSEHWEELVDAWMCHSDQTMHDQVAKHSGGFWPDAGQALVGGSYILFEQSSVLRNNVRISDYFKTGTEWHMLRCLCGAVIGRCKEKAMGDTPSAMLFRMLKYAIRPVSPTTEPFNIPLSAFIVEDMLEFVRAHATYRFVILDEEEERPRLLIWLFKPSMRLSYAIPMSCAPPPSGCIHASKVLYKIVGPHLALTDLKSTLNKYPGFPQAEHLYYPMDVCQRLATSLKESNTAYPESMRTMTGLQVGWLLRA